MTPSQSSPSKPDPFARHRMRVITVSGDGRITSDVLQPWSAVTTTNLATGESPDFPAAEIPSGVLRRSANGEETLMTVDGLRLELDGAGNMKVHDDEGEIRGPGIFMVVEVLPQEG
ncbi:hypothetical protein [Actinomadura rudentiformis]|uniref:Uncharacterized protein n=1 Tax=Actinomadura rudentiformis TaxID=359158 RepID=A0A6H9Y986_9ACTN|nr:hypothetical protein [Actinomadura rudentiformis]KAB2340875.1 hypothetical protein F8566_43980 [Actinomadura rudentiformis]